MALGPVRERGGTAASNASRRVRRRSPPGPSTTGPIRGSRPGPFCFSSRQSSRSSARTRSASVHSPS
eukprot:3594246-Lingulodinium_polyedra.AAC.1